MRLSPWIAGITLAGAVVVVVVGGRDAASRLQDRWQIEIDAGMPPGGAVQAEVLGRTVRMSGVVETDEARDALRARVATEHPHLIVDDHLRVRPAPPTGPVETVEADEPVAPVAPVVDESAPRWAEADPATLRSLQSQLDAILKVQPIEFAAASAGIDPASRDTIDWLARLLAVFPEIVVEVAGHADSRGSLDFNRPLSESRAQAVRDLLVERGVDGDRLLAVGRGEIRPADPADDDLRRHPRIELIARGVRP